MRVYLEYNEDFSNSHKFWKANNEDHPQKYMVEVKWGRIGTNGQLQQKLFNTNEEAEAFIVKKRNEKITKGYTEV